MGSLLNYFASLPRAALDRLYSDGWTCQGLLRALPPLARLYALRLVAVSAEEGGGLPLVAVEAWAQDTPEAQKKHREALAGLRRLRLLLEGEGASLDAAVGAGKAIWLHRGFALQLRNCLCVGGVLNETPPPEAGSSSAQVLLTDLERHANDQWERVLQAILRPPVRDVWLEMKCDGASVQELLQEAHLLEPSRALDADGDVDMPSEAEDRGNGLRMTRGAARYLLQPIHRQVWLLVKAYMELAERGTPGTRDGTLCFLMRLGLLQLGQSYRMEDPSLDAAQRATLADMALLGLVYRPPDAPHLYYATHLSQHLLSGSAGATAAAAAAMTAAAGFIVLETNFRLYAYTASALWAQVLRLFMDIRYVLPNMVVGDLTRDSVLRAARMDVTAADISTFLERNAHPCMARLVPVMPENVLTVLQIWSKEPHRLTTTRVFVYESFATREEFDATRQYAKDTKAFVWERNDPEPSRCALAVKAVAHTEMKRFIRTSRAEAAAAATTAAAGGGPAAP